jgi:predicted RNA binding protein YcfA (HicA-like mRNA interferase family)
MTCSWTSGRLSPLALREVKRKRQAAGFGEVSQRGSHVKFVRTSPEGVRVAIVPQRTLRSILNQAGLTLDEFERL